MTILLSLGIIVLAIAASIFYVLVFQRTNQPLPKNKVKIGDAIFEVEIASTTLAQARGLSFRDRLPEGHGMLFLFNRPAVRSFWMKDMRFPIDIVWIAGDTIAGFAENVKPEPGVPLWDLTIYHSPDGTDKVLEVPAGTVAKDSVKVGDTVQVGI